MDDLSGRSSGLEIAIRLSPKSPAIGVHTVAPARAPAMPEVSLLAKPFLGVDNQVPEVGVAPDLLRDRLQGVAVLHRVARKVSCPFSPLIGW
jgi:hypothetical protein